MVLTASPDSRASSELYQRDIDEDGYVSPAGIPFLTMNDALGARPDWQLADAAPAPVGEAVSCGRAVSEPPKP